MHKCEHKWYLFTRTLRDAIYKVFQFYKVILSNNRIVILLLMRLLLLFALFFMTHKIATAKCTVSRDKLRNGRTLVINSRVNVRSIISLYISVQYKQRYDVVDTRTIAWCARGLCRRLLKLQPWNRYFFPGENDYTHNPEYELMWALCLPLSSEMAENLKRNNRMSRTKIETNRKIQRKKIKSIRIILLCFFTTFNRKCKHSNKKKEEK